MNKKLVYRMGAGWGGHIALVFSLAVFMASYMIPIPTPRTSSSDPSSEAGTTSGASQDTVIVPELSPGFEQALTQLCMLDFARCVMEVPFTQRIEEVGVIADIMDGFTDVSLDMRVILPVEVTVGLDAEVIQIADVSFTEDGQRVEHMTVILPPLEITSTSIDYADVCSHFREGHIQGTIEAVMRFLAESDSSAIETAKVMAIESGLIEQAESNAIVQVAQLLQEMGVIHVDVIVESTSTGNETNVALLEKGR